MGLRIALRFVLELRCDLVLHVLVAVNAVKIINGWDCKLRIFCFCFFQGKLGKCGLSLVTY